MRSTPVMAFAVLLACLPAPARAVELIDLHGTEQLAAFQPGQTAGDEWADLPPAMAPFDTPLSADRWPAPATRAHSLAHPTAYPPAHPPTPTPVPEPVSVLMLACGLLLMVPGAWAARWSRLGDTKSLLQRRHP